MANNMATLSSYTPSLSEKLTALLARNWYGDTKEGYAQANRLMDIVNMTPAGIATGMYDAGRAAGGGNMMEAGLLGGLAMAPIPGSVKKQGIKAYHGSPHSFDKFSMDKIGTGEGAQAYGHGLYFAEGEGVAKSYRDTLATRITNQYEHKAKNMDDAWINAAKSMRRDYSMGETETVDVLKKSYKGISDEQAKYAYEMANPGSMYEVNIDADPEQFLDWDKPLSEQPESVRSLLQKKIEAYKARGETLMPDYMKGFESGTLEGNRVYSGVGGGSQQNSSEALKQAGIPGIKYLDAGSRGQKYWVLRHPQGGTFEYPTEKEALDALKKNPEYKLEAPNQSRNYVVFDDKLVSIVRKYGIAGASAILGYDLLASVDPAQAAELQSLEPK